MIKVNTTDVEDEEAQIVWDYILCGHIAQDNDYHENSIVEKINDMVPAGYKADKITIHSVSITDFIEGDKE